MADFGNFLENLENGLGELAKDSMNDFAAAALKDGKAFIEKARDDLNRWTKLLAAGELTKEDFEFLVAGKKDLAEMETLKEAGLTLVRIEKFQNALISLIIDTAIDTFL